MNKINEELNYLRSKLKDMLTADNTEAITDLSSHIDTLEHETNEQDKKLSEVKDKLVNYVKFTGFKEAPKDVIEDTPKSIDDLIGENINKILNARK